MPDYGLRPPPYFSGELPVGILGHAPYGWQPGQTSNIGDTPYNNYFSMGDFVYERLDWQKFKKQLYSEGGPGGRPQNTAGVYSNPPFMGAGQMTGPNGAPSWMRGPEGGVQRILRGYLRRQHVEPGKPESFVRLYFMYNPDQVQRQYLSWAEDTTADPTNALGVDTASSPTGTPSMTTLSFTLYFDRQIELATIAEHPGVLVDLQTFDVLSGNLVQGVTLEGSTETPVLPPGTSIPENTDYTDNRAGQYQPRVSGVATTVTAVFSPSLAVEGVLAGASVTFTKFSKRMTPSTMALNLTLMVQYVGKNNNQSLVNGGDVGAGTLGGSKVYNPTTPGFVAPTTQYDRNRQTLAGANAAVAWADGNLMDDRTGNPGVNHYSTALRNQGAPCQNTGETYTDRGSFIWRAFWVIGWTGTDRPTDLLGLGGSCVQGAPTVDVFFTTIRRLGSGNDRRWQIFHDEEIRIPPDFEQFDDLAEEFKSLRRGDVLVKNGDVAFFYAVTGDIKGENWDKKIIQLMHSSGDDKKDAEDHPYVLGGSIMEISMKDIWLGWTLWARPEPWGPTSDVGPGGSLGGPQPVDPGDDGGGGGGGTVPPGTLTYEQTVEALTGQGGNIRLSPAALPAWQNWRSKWNGPIPCTTGWRSPDVQEAARKKDEHDRPGGPPRFTTADKSYHCKGLAVDVNNDWLQALPQSEQSRLRVAAAACGWGQSRWRVKGQGQNTPYEASCNADNGTDTFEPWHFTWGGCG